MLTSLKPRLLLSAESFGFGPSAAIASFFPLLRSHFRHISFIGQGHALDLQHSLSYDRIYDIPTSSIAAHAIYGSHDILLTSLDFYSARHFRSLGKPTVIYDPLFWYWPQLSTLVEDPGVLYLAQNFFGVAERLACLPKTGAATMIVPPTVPCSQARIDPSIILVSLGGLENPFWPIDSSVAYARLMLRAVLRSLPPNASFVVATSRSIADQLQEFGAAHFTREAMLSLLSKTKYAVATPGLGNIYDLAAFDIPSLLLPPANDSQGLQLAELRRHQAFDASIDWSDLHSSLSVNYSSSQTKVMTAIATSIAQIANTRALEKPLWTACAKGIADVSSRSRSDSSVLMDTFGRGGAEAVLREVITAAQRLVI